MGIGHHQAERALISFVALHLAFQHMKKLGAIPAVPLKDHVAAISCGLYRGKPAYIAQGPSSTDLPAGATVLRP